MDSFFNIPREQLINYFPEIIKNSEAQFNSAQELAQSGKPGTLGMGMSHLLISTEEMIKALIVVMDARGFQFRTTKGMDIFFKNHEIRFFIGWLIFASTLFGDDLMKLLKELKEEPQKLIHFEQEFTEDKQNFEKKLMRYFFRKLIIIKGEMKWFSQAEIFRQNGFYTDMNGNLATPLQITHEQFEQTRVRIERVNKAVKLLIDMFLSNDQLMIESVEQMKAILSKRTGILQMTLYDMISTKLSEMRKGRKSFFDEFGGELIKMTEREERRTTKKFTKLLEKGDRKNVAGE